MTDPRMERYTFDPNFDPEEYDMASNDHHYDDDGNLLCMDDRGDNECIGPVDWHIIGNRADMKSFPRCRRHFDLRMDSYENSIERYADSDVAPSWFDPTAAGERWDDDY